MKATTNPARNQDDETLPPGMMKFQDADIFQFLEIYQELAGVKILNRDRLGSIKITLKTQTELSLRQAVWMMEAILQLSDLKVERKDDRTVTIVPVPDARRTPGDAR